MKNLTFKTSGAAPELKTEIELPSKSLADYLMHNLNGSPANDLQNSQLTQEFVDKYNVIAKYSSGTFLGFKISDEDSALAEFKSFKWKLS